MTNQILSEAGLTALTPEECANTLGGSSTTWTFEGSDGGLYTATRTVDSNGGVTLSVRPANHYEKLMYYITQER